MLQNVQNIANKHGIFYYYNIHYQYITNGLSSLTCCEL